MSFNSKSPEQLAKEFKYLRDKNFTIFPNLGMHKNSKFSQNNILLPIKKNNNTKRYKI
tara:strand:+ start:470 stop:643 length:174 start_codon:yes stop_codon:yes gene_type:complete